MNKRRRPQALALYMSRRNRSIKVPADWTPHQAVAVFGILDDLLEIIWQQYNEQIQPILWEQMHPVDEPFTPGNLGEEDVPF